MKTTVDLGKIDLEGDGKIIVETGLEEGVKCPPPFFVSSCRVKAISAGAKGCIDRNG